MAANIRLRSIYYNTTATGSGDVTWKIEILDTEAVAQIINFECTQPDESFEGLTQNLEPGIYPSSFKFGMFIRSTPKIRNGTTFGPTDTFLDDIFSAPEGRFLVRYFKDNVFQWVGPIIYDQCSYEDAASPFLLNITAVDGLVRWQTQDYISEVGQIVYKSFENFNINYSNTPITAGLVGTEWIVISNKVDNNFHGSDPPPLLIYKKTTTNARREVYAPVSPGTGWVDQGGGLWAKELTYVNEQIAEDLTAYHETYSLTRDIDNEKHRNVLEFFTRSMAITNLAGEYASPTCMFDTAVEWYENNMNDLAADPCDQMRVHEFPFIDKTWAEGMKELCKLLNLRIYFSNGRYHFEQISLRDNDGFTRFKYESDGTLIGSETPTLDLDFSALEISPTTGGIYKVLPAFRSVEATVDFDGANLLENVNWNEDTQGEKYLGRIKRVSGGEQFRLILKAHMTSTFDPAILSTLSPGVINSYCRHKFVAQVSLRLSNAVLGVNYWAENTAYAVDANWITSPISNDFYIPFGSDSNPFSLENYGITKDWNVGFHTEDLPDPVGALYDVFVSLTFRIEFDNLPGAYFWHITYPNNHWHLITAWDNLLKLFQDLNVQPFVELSGSASVGKTYYVENDVSNSIRIKIPLSWGDVNQTEKSIEIYNGTDWKKSSEWSIGGVGTPVDIGELLVKEVISLRTLPRKLYNGSYVSTMPNAESRLLRGTTYYLPLSCDKNTDEDEFAGEFLEIAKVTPPDITTLDEPIDDGTGIFGTVGVSGNSPDDPVDPIPMGFTTNETITATATLTQCDIVNTDGVFCQTGSIIRVYNPTTGENENVKLTQDIDPTDTIMYFESHVFVYSFPTLSPLTLVGDIVTIPTNTNQLYYFFKMSHTATTIYAPNFTFVDPEAASPNNINKRYQVWRGGVKMTCDFSPGTDADRRLASYYFDGTAHTWIFYDDGLVNEMILIIAY